MKRMRGALPRIALAGFIGLLVMTGWFLWRAPSLDELRPQIEKTLAARLGLKHLQLGKLSWRWAGHTWLKANNITFTGPAERIRVQDAELEVRLSSWDLLRGEIRPTSISLHRGRIALNIPEGSGAGQFPIPAGQLHIEDSSVTFHYGQLSHHLEHLNLHLDADRRTLNMELKGFSLTAAWNPALQPSEVSLNFENLNWLPVEWRQRSRGEFSARLHLRRDANAAWQLRCALHSTGGTTLLDKRQTPLFAFNRLELEANIETGAGLGDVRAVTWQRLDWQHAASAISAHGAWRNSRLKLAVSSDNLDLASLATWLGMATDSDWRTWLGGVRGTARNLKAELTLAQKKPWTAPQISTSDIKKLRLQTELADAVMPLGAPGEKIGELSGVMRLANGKVEMDVRHALLPRDAGRVHGLLRINNLERPVFAIKGSGEVDVERCRRWLKTGHLPHLIWQDAPAAARFTLFWPLYAELPARGEAHLTPAPAWQVSVMGRALKINAGDLHWQAGKGVRFSGMRIRYEKLDASLDMQLKEGADKALQISSIKLLSDGDFGELARRLRMPIDAPDGQYRLQITYPVKQKKGAPIWRLQADLRNAGWENLLGAHKQTGKPYALDLRGRWNKDKLTITRISNSGGAPLVSGSGSISQKRLALDITSLRAPSFRGGIRLIAPFDGAPTEINLASDFMNEGALPKKTSQIVRLADLGPTGGKQRKWVLRGKFRRIRWNGVSIRGVDVRFASSLQGIGSLQADALDAAQMSARDVHAFFHLGDGGRIDVRQLTARILGQQLRLSGEVSPEPSGGLRWTGFAGISGDFGQIIQRLDASRLFKSGVVHALWSGSGIIREDKPWWNAMHGRLRLRADDGRILEGGTMTKLLAALSLADLPHFLTGLRKDMTGPGMLYKRLQLEAAVEGEKAGIRSLAMRASALDMAGKGQINLASGVVDLYVTARPLQNIDAFLRMIPLLRDIVLGPAKSVFRKVYHVHGPLHDAKVEAVSAEEAGLPSSGLLEQLISLPGRWFDSGRKTLKKAVP